MILCGALLRFIASYLGLIIVVFLAAIGGFDSQTQAQDAHQIKQPADNRVESFVYTQPAEELDRNALFDLAQPLNQCSVSIPCCCLVGTNGLCTTVSDCTSMGGACVPMAPGC